MKIIVFDMLNYIKLQLLKNHKIIYKNKKN